MGWNRANRSCLGGGAVGVPIHQTAGQRLWSTAQRVPTKILQAGLRSFPLPPVVGELSRERRIITYDRRFGGRATSLVQATICKSSQGCPP